tara:strand:- start:526 stop:699 length:174 start_codon:yes stop_codon:yes gene_type:complete
MFKRGDLVKVLDTTSTRIYRRGLVLKSYKNNTCKIFMLDCDDIRKVPINQLKKGDTI